MTAVSSSAVLQGFSLSSGHSGCPQYLTWMGEEQASYQGSHALLKTNYIRESSQCAACDKALLYNVIYSCGLPII